MIEEDTYQRIANIMTVNGTVMSRGAARHTAMLTFEKFVKECSNYFGVDPTDDVIKKAARDHAFQIGLSELLQNME